jgi:hypothetical protein
MDAEKVEANLSASGLHVEVGAGVCCRQRHERRHAIAFAEDVMDLDSLVWERDAKPPHKSQRAVEAVSHVSIGVEVTPVRVYAIGKSGLVERGPGSPTSTQELVVRFP